MKHLPQFPSILAIYCFCLLQNPSSGYPPHSDDSPDGLDAVQLERLAYWATLSRQPKVNQDMYKRFLFHYSRTQEPTHPVKTGFPAVHPLMRLAAKLANGRMRRFPQRDPGAVALDFMKKPWFPPATPVMESLLNERSQGPVTNCQGMEETLKITPSRIVQEFSGKGELDQMRQPNNYFGQMSKFFL